MFLSCNVIIQYSTLHCIRIVICVNVAMQCNAMQRCGCAAAERVGVRQAGGRRGRDVSRREGHPPEVQSAHGARERNRAQPVCSASPSRPVPCRPFLFRWLLRCALLCCAHNTRTSSSNGVRSSVASAWNVWRLTCRSSPKRIRTQRRSYNRSSTSSSKGTSSTPTVQLSALHCRAAVSSAPLLSRFQGTILVHCSLFTGHNPHWIESASAFSRQEICN